MMSTFGDLMKNATDKGLLGSFETTVTYTPRNGDGLEISSRLGPIRSAPQRGARGEMLPQMRSCRISKSDVAAPSVDDSLLIDGVTWSVDEISDETDFAATLELVTIEQGARHGENFYSGGER